MQVDLPYPLPPDERERLSALYALDILDSGPEPVYDRIAAMAARLFRAPIAVVYLVDEKRQWAKAACGFERTEMPRDLSFCAHAIVEDRPLVVCDATADPRFQANPLVTGGRKIRFYAGAPLRTGGGYAIGSLCVIDTVARERPAQDLLDSLADLASLVVEQFEFRVVTAEKARLEAAHARMMRRSNEELEKLVAERASLLEKTVNELLAEVEKHKQTQNELAQHRNELNEALSAYQFLADVMPQIVWICHADGQARYHNEKWFSYTGLTPERTKSEGWLPVLHPDDVENTVGLWRHSLETGGAFEAENRLRHASDGVYRWHLNRALPFRNRDGEIVSWFGTSTDINEQKTEKQRLEVDVLQRTEALRRSLAEKEFLLRETHHRVKNNLQVISSLLRMQASVLRDAEAKAALKESQARVLSMALVHERLYGISQLDQIDFGEYARALVGEIARYCVEHEGKITSRFETSQVFLGIDQAIPCGLILNELITNALKYAYPSGGGGEIVVGVEQTSGGRVHLSVTDHGIGLPEGLDWKNPKSMGLTVVGFLAKQLEAEMAVHSAGGTTFTVRFQKALAHAAAG